VALNQYNKKNLFDELAGPTSLTELGVDKAKVIRAIESLKVHLTEINPTNIALELGVPRSFIYADLELLEYIYRNASHLNGQDKLINDLIRDLKSHKRKITRLNTQLEQSEKAKDGSFNDGFSKGASLNFSKPAPSIENTELWARGVLYIDSDVPLTEALIKRCYRALVTLLHPDQTGKDTSDLLNTLRKAHDYLIDRL
jgi:hypothetical protein